MGGGGGREVKAGRNLPGFPQGEEEREERKEESGCRRQRMLYLMKALQVENPQMQRAIITKLVFAITICLLPFHAVS